jgi:hypothetical protein
MRRAGDVDARAAVYHRSLQAIPERKEAAAMEWFWASVAYAVFGAIGALGLFTMLYWFDVAAARSKRSTG